MTAEALSIETPNSRHLSLVPSEFCEPYVPTLDELELAALQALKDLTGHEDELERWKAALEAGRENNLAEVRHKFDSAQTDIGAEREQQLRTAEEEYRARIAHIEETFDQRVRANSGRYEEARRTGISEFEERIGLMDSQLEAVDNYGQAILQLIELRQPLLAEISAKRQKIDDLEQGKERLGVEKSSLKENIDGIQQDLAAVQEQQAATIKSCETELEELDHIKSLRPGAWLSGEHSSADLASTGLVASPADIEKFNRATRLLAEARTPINELTKLAEAAQNARREVIMQVADIEDKIDDLEKELAIPLSKLSEIEGQLKQILQEAKNRLSQDQFPQSPLEEFTAEEKDEEGLDEDDEEVVVPLISSPTQSTPSLLASVVVRPGRRTLFNEIGIGIREGKINWRRN